MSSHPAIGREYYRFYAPRRNVAVRAIQGQMKLSVRSSRAHQQQGSGSSGSAAEEPSRDQMKALLELREAEHFEKLEAELRRRGQVPYAAQPELPRVAYHSLAKKAALAEAVSASAASSSSSSGSGSSSSSGNTESSSTESTGSTQGTEQPPLASEEEKAGDNEAPEAAAGVQLNQVDWSEFDDADASSSSDDDDDDENEDGSEDGSSSDSDSDDDDGDDEEDELMRELARIKEEREAARRKQEEAAEAARREEAEKAVLLGNPLLSAQLEQQQQAQSQAKDSFLVKRRWDDDVVFRNQSRSAPTKAQKRFINDTIRSDFHRRFLDRYIK